MRSASVYYDGMFSVTEIELPEKVMQKEDISENCQFNINLKASMGEGDVICESIYVNSQQYKNGDLILLALENCDDVTVGHIKTVLIKNNKAYFVVERFRAVRNSLRYFVSMSSTEETFEFVHSASVKDYKPLNMRGTSSRFVFNLHHHISHDYD